MGLVLRNEGFLRDTVVWKVRLKGKDREEYEQSCWTRSEETSPTMNLVKEHV